MKKVILPALIFIFLTILLSQKPSNQHDGTFAPGEAIIMLKPGENRSGIDAIRILQEDYNDAGLTPIRELSERLGIWLVKYDPESVRESDMIGDLKAHPLVKIAQNNHYVSLRQNIPSDTDFNKQWNMNNTGQYGGTFDSDIDGPEAWDITTGGITATGDTIIIAVIDDGFDLEHSDIEFWKNTQEIPLNAIDDDGNGYIDDYHGWNGYTNSHNMPPAMSHGTHVSGIAGAVGDNDRGVTGVNWNTRIMPVGGSSTLESIVVTAYSYVYEMRKRYNESNGATGAFVVVTNSSFGVDYGQPEDYPIWAAMYDSLGQEGVLSVAATMNRNENVDEVGDIPTSLPNEHLITVTNTDKNDVRINAAYGLESIDLGAPGTAIWSTNINDGYSSKTGTSMASPHVAGAVALLYAAAGSAFMEAYHNDPASTSLLIKNYILSSTDPAPDLEGITVTGGRLNVAQAIQRLQNPGIISNVSEITEVTFPNHTVETVFELTNTLDSARSFTIGVEEPAEWLSIVPDSGTILSKQTVTIDVVFNTNQTEVGVYTNNITVYYGEEFLTIAVRLEVVHPLIFSPESVFDEIVTGQDETYTVYFENLSEKTVNYNVFLHWPAPWIEIMPVSGSIPGNSTRGILITASTGNNPVGNYPNAIDVGYDDTDTTGLPFILRIKDQEILTDTDSIVMELLPGTADSVVITLQNLTNSPVDIEISPEIAGGWISYEPAEATLIPLGTFQVKVKLNSDGLSPDIYLNNLIVTYKGNDELTIPVLLDVTDTGIDENGILSGFDIYPNPVDRSARISFFLEEPANVSITLTGLNGMEILAIAGQNFPQGINTVSWTPSGLEGIYLVRINVGKTITARKILITK